MACQSCGGRRRASLLPTRNSSVTVTQTRSGTQTVTPTEQKVKSLRRFTK